MILKFVYYIALNKSNFVFVPAGRFLRCSVHFLRSSVSVLGFFPFLLRSSRLWLLFLIRLLASLSTTLSHRNLWLSPFPSDQVSCVYICCLCLLERAPGWTGLTIIDFLLARTLRLNSSDSGRSTTCVFYLGLVERSAVH